MRLCAISVDLDEIPNYFAIHGLPAPEGAGATAVYDVGLERLAAFARGARVPLTLFAVGADLARAGSSRALAALVDQGHEAANHTLDHPYDLTRLPRDEIERQVQGGIDAISRATGVRPTGFRAPGYTITDTVYDVLGSCGVEYDSSVFPCPPYYLLKLAAMGAIRLRGRESRSVLDHPGVLRAPTEPYRVGRPYTRAGDGILELPIQVTPVLRLPFFGTSITMSGPRAARWLARRVVGAPLVNLELHGIDVLDATDGFEALRSHQLDARIPSDRKLESLEAVVSELRRAGYAFVRLDEAAKAFA